MERIEDIWVGWQDIGHSVVEGRRREEEKGRDPRGVEDCTMGIGRKPLTFYL